MAPPDPIRYRTLLLDGGRLSRPLRARELRGAIRSRAAHAAGPFRIDHGSGPGRAWPRNEAIDRAVRLAWRAGVGDRILLLPAAGRTTRIVKAHLRPSILDGCGTVPVCIFHAFVVQEFPGVESWGIHACRRVAGTRKWSQHAWDNAEDWHAPVRVMLALFEAAIDLHAQYSVATVIHDEKIWRFDWPGGPHPYAGEDSHHDHVHVDFLPEHFGTPPCARSLKARSRP